MSYSRDDLLMHALNLSSRDTLKRTTINRNNRQAIERIGNIHLDTTIDNLQFKPSFENELVDNQKPLPLVATPSYTINLSDVLLTTGTLQRWIVEQCLSNDIEIPDHISLETASCVSVEVAVPGTYAATDNTNSEGVAKAKFAPVYRNTSNEEQRVYVLCYPLNGATPPRLDRLKVGANSAMSCLNAHGGGGKTALADVDLPNTLAMDLSVNEAERFKKIKMNGYVIAFIKYDLIKPQPYFAIRPLAYIARQQLPDPSEAYGSRMSMDELFFSPNNPGNMGAVANSFNQSSFSTPMSLAINNRSSSGVRSVFNENAQTRSKSRDKKANEQNAYNISVAGSAASSNTVQINEEGKRILSGIQIFIARSVIINVKNPLQHDEAVARIQFMKTAANQIDQAYASVKHIDYHESQLALIQNPPVTENDVRNQQAYNSQMRYELSNYNKLLATIKPYTANINPEKSAIIPIVLLRMLGIKQTPAIMKMQPGSNYISEKFDINFHFRIDVIAAQNLVNKFLTEFAPGTNKARVVPRCKSNNADSNVLEIAIDGNVLLSSAFQRNFTKTLTSVLENEPWLMEKLRKDSLSDRKSMETCIEELEQVVASFTNVDAALRMTQAIMFLIIDLKSQESSLTKWKSHDWPIRSGMLFFQSTLPDSKANDEFIKGEGKLIEDDLINLQIMKPGGR